MTLNFISSLPLGALISAVAFDAQGDMYVGGAFRGTVNFDPNSNDPAHNLTDNDSGNDPFIAEYSPTNTLLWVRQMTVSRDAGVTSLVVDRSTGSVYAALSIFGTVNLDPGGSNQTITVTEGTGEALVAKLTPAGALDPTGPAETFSSSIGVAGESLAYEPSSRSVYLAGNFRGNASYGSTPVLTSASGGGVVDAFLLKLDSDLGLVWARAGEVPYSSGSTADFAEPGVAVDRSGDVFIAGSQTRDGSPLDETGYVEKFTAGGDRVVTEQFGGTLGTIVSNTSARVANDGLAIDAAGDVYVGGSFDGDLSVYGVNASSPTFTLINAGGSDETKSQEDAFLIKFDNALDPLWGRALGSPADELGTAVAVDGANDVYLGGGLGATATFGPTGGAGTTITDPDTSGVGNYSAFILKVDSDGNLLDSTVAVGTASGSSGDNGALVDTMAVSPVGTVAVTGDTFYPATFGGVSFAAATNFVGVLGTPVHSGPGPGTTGGGGGTTGKTGGGATIVAPPVFVSESRALVKVKKHRKATIFQLTFSGALDAAGVAAGRFRVTQARRGHGRHHPAPVAVAVASAVPSASGTGVTIALGRYRKNQPLTLVGTGLVGADGAAVPTFTTGL